MSDLVVISLLMMALPLVVGRMVMPRTVRSRVRHSAGVPGDLNKRIRRRA